jgi:hypothetical protein
MLRIPAKNLKTVMAGVTAAMTNLLRLQKELE